MQFIVDDLKSGGKHFEYINSNIENQISILSSETLTGISFTASAFKNASTIYIYPTYEFTSNKQPRGKDSFSFQLGAAMRPYEYGGKLWYKDNTMNDWKVGGTLTANNQQLSGAEFSGSQLGTPDYAMKLKGVTYCHATAGNSSDKRIVMGYLYNPQKTGYSISFSYNGGGISYSPSGTAYTAYKTMNLCLSRSTNFSDRQIVFKVFSSNLSKIMSKSPLLVEKRADYECFRNCRNKKYRTTIQKNF